MHAKKIVTTLGQSLIFLFLAGVSAHAAQPEAQDPSVIVLYGDSISVGYNLEENFTVDLGNGRDASQLPGSRPTTELSALLNDVSELEDLRTSIVVNWGDGGTTSGVGAFGIANVLAATESQRVGRKYYVLIKYGTNDVGQGIATTTTAFNIGRIIDSVRARGADFIPLAANLIPRSDYAVENHNTQIENTIVAKGLQPVRLYESFVSHPNGWQSLMGLEQSGLTGQFIRLHPNVAGYQVIARTWYNQSLAGLIEPDPLPEPDPVVAPWLLLLLD